MPSKYVTTAEIAEIAEIKSVIKAREILRRANEVATQRGYFIPNQRKAPRGIVLELLGIRQKEDS